MVLPGLILPEFASIAVSVPAFLPKPVAAGMLPKSASPYLGTFGSCVP